MKDYFLSDNSKCEFQVYLTIRSNTTFVPRVPYADLRVYGAKTMPQVDNNKAVGTGMVIGAIGTQFLFIVLHVLTPKTGNEVGLLDRIRLGSECLS